LCLVMGAKSSVRGDRRFRGYAIPQAFRLGLKERPEFNPWTVHVEYVGEQLELGQVSVRVFQFCPIIVIPQILRNHSFIIINAM